jgi:hypothetical protein
VLRIAKAITLGHSEKKAWNADIRCCAAPWQFASPYSCSHWSTAGALLEHFNWELFDKSLCSRGLAPKNYRLFTYLKNLLLSQHINSNEELTEGAET